MELHKKTEADLEFEQSLKNAEKAVEDHKKMHGHQIKLEGEGFTPIRTNFDQAVAEKEKFRSKKKDFFKSVEMRDMAEKVMEAHGIDIGPASVGCLLCYPNISKKRAAKTIRCNELLQMFSGYDYLVMVSGELWDMLDNDTKKMVLYHQLMQINPVFKTKDQSWVFKLRKPDFQDFYRVNDKHGNTWYKTVQATVSSLYDLDPVQEYEVKV